MATRARIRRPQSRTIHTGWLRSVWYWRAMGLPWRAVAVQQMSRRSSPSRYSRRLSKSRPRPRCCEATQLQVDLAAAGEKDLLLFAGAQGRVDAYRLRERRFGPALDEAQG